MFLYHCLLALSFGVLGSSHCAGMCGGITAALGAQMHNKTIKNKFFYLLLYQLGRVTSYSLAGLLFALFGYAVGSISPNIQIIMRTIAAMLLICMGLYIGNWWKGLSYLEKIGYKLWSKLQPIMLIGFKTRSTKKIFYAGMVWGWLPCGLLYSTLLWASSLEYHFKTPILMLCFGLGTMPAILTIGSFSYYTNKIFGSKITNLASIIIIISGILSLPNLSNYLFKLVLEV